MITIKEIRSLLINLKADIADEYRASEDDTIPGMCVTIATTDGCEWTYQTGDNSFTGGCYHYRHWSVISLYRRSNCTELAREVVNELLGLVEEQKQYDAETYSLRGFGVGMIARGKVCK